MIPKFSDNELLKIQSESFFVPVIIIKGKLYISVDLSTQTVPS
jgi:hypothetical protein